VPLHRSDRLPPAGTYVAETSGRRAETVAAGSGRYLRDFAAAELNHRSLRAAGSRGDLRGPASSAAPPAISPPGRRA